MITAKTPAEFFALVQQDKDCTYENIMYHAGRLCQRGDPYNVLAGPNLQFWCMRAEFERLNEILQRLDVPLKMLAGNTFENPWGTFTRDVWQWPLADIVSHRGES